MSKLSKLDGIRYANGGRKGGYVIYGRHIAGSKAINAYIKREHILQIHQI